jgi:hypothetical protein
MTSHVEAYLASLEPGEWPDPGEYGDACRKDRACDLASALAQQWDAAGPLRRLWLWLTLRRPR